jgi:hypothetical protein
MSDETIHDREYDLAEIDSARLNRRPAFCADPADLERLKTLTDEGEILALASTICGGDPIVMSKVRAALWRASLPNGHRPMTERDAYEAATEARRAYALAMYPGGRAA